MFVAPLVRSSIHSAWLRSIAIRTMIAACIALVSSAANVIVLYAMDGKEMIWVCLGAFGVDIVVNAVVLYWAMQGPTSASPPPAPNQTIHSPFTPRLHTPRPGHHDIVHSLEMGSYAHKNSGVYPAALLDFSQPQEEVLSQGMTVTSSVCIPTLDEPEPALRSPSSVDSWERQIALASGGLAAKRSDSQRTSPSLREGDLVHKSVKDSEIYGSNYERIEFPEKRRCSSSTPPPPSQ
ncbi:hypothetical protein CTheo_4255 [Ceratobasidium theobromae]|uniref:Transmembrane protein n=1 Tax=Ceratobasidium theobromae TaxID=1582974 RepID=A0A5N5QKQ0_9AGAM|nr:hypothetical protein CTheo_4255 [Ceratobasidium theobromae]